MNSNNFAIEMFQRFKNAFMTQDTDYLNVIFQFNGRELYAEKFVLSMASTTFESMLSDRWNPTNGPIKIESYSYEEFKELLTFIYSGECHLTNENIFQMLDIAAFYQITHIKEFCEEFLLKMEINIGNVFKCIELVSNYSMMKFKNCVNAYLYEDFVNFVVSEKFLKSTKTEIENFLFASDFDKETDFQPVRIQPNQIYEAVCRWVEYQRSNGNDYGIKEILPHYLQIKITNALGHSISGVISNRLNNYSHGSMMFMKYNRSHNMFGNDIFWDTEYEKKQMKQQLFQENGDHYYLSVSQRGKIYLSPSNETLNGRHVLAKMELDGNEFIKMQDCKFDFF